MPKGYTVNPKRDKRGLTKPQQVFADNILEVGKEKAAEMAYPDASPESQRVIAHQNLEKIEVLSSISTLANKKGLTKDLCLEAIKNGLTSTKKTWNKMGDEIEYDDNSSRLKAAELGLRVHGELRNDRTILPVPVTKEQYQDLCREFWGSKPDGSGL